MKSQSSSCSCGRRSQSSLIELLLLSIGASFCLVVLLSSSSVSVESIRASRLESESVLLNFLLYRPIFYNESFSLLVNQACINSSLFERGSYLFNESVRVIQALNYNNSFILFINSGITDVVVFNKQESVCLVNAQLASYQLGSNCTVIYGEWKGEAPLMC